MHFDASFFVAVGFALFILILGYYGVHMLIAGALDQRGKLIQAELDEARKLREEAEGVLASYKARAAAAEALRAVGGDQEERQGLVVGFNRRGRDHQGRGMEFGRK